MHNASETEKGFAATKYYFLNLRSPMVKKR